MSVELENQDTATITNVQGVVDVSLELENQDTATILVFRVQQMCQQNQRPGYCYYTSVQGIAEVSVEQENQDTATITNVQGVPEVSVELENQDTATITNVQGVAEVSVELETRITRILLLSNQTRIRFNPKDSQGYWSTFQVILIYLFILFPCHQLRFPFIHPIFLCLIFLCFYTLLIFLSINHPVCFLFCPDPGVPLFILFIHFFFFSFFLPSSFLLFYSFFSP